MGNPNPNAVQLLQQKYQAYVQLLQARLDIDSKLLIVATDITQITGAAFANAPVAAPAQPAPAPAPTPEPQVTVEKTEVVKEEPKVVEPEPTPETETKVEEPVAQEATPAEREPVPYAEIQALIQEIIQQGKQTQVAPVAAKYGPYQQLEADQQIEMEDALRGVING